MRKIMFSRCGRGSFFVRRYSAVPHENKNEPRLTSRLKHILLLKKIELEVPRPG